MENIIHFLTIHTAYPKLDNAIVKHELYWLEEQHKVGYTKCLIENFGKDNECQSEEYFPTKFMSIHDFSVNVDKYMGHPCKVFSDEGFVDELMSGYLFDESYDLCD